MNLQGSQGTATSTSMSQRGSREEQKEAQGDEDIILHDNMFFNEFDTNTDLSPDA